MAVLTLLALLVAPQTPAPGPEHTTKRVTSKAHQTTKNRDVTLVTTAVIEDGRLQLAYEVRNSGKAAIYLFNKL
jgi:hypothetical protein